MRAGPRTRSSLGIVPLQKPRCQNRSPCPTYYAWRNASRPMSPEMRSNSDVNGPLDLRHALRVWRAAQAREPCRRPARQGLACHNAQEEHVDVPASPCDFAAEARRETCMCAVLDLATYGHGRRVRRRHALHSPAVTPRRPVANRLVLPRYARRLRERRQYFQAEIR